MGRCTTSRAVTGGKLRSSITPFSDFILDFLSIIHRRSVLLQLLPLMWCVLSTCETCEVQEGLSEEPRIWELLTLVDSLRYRPMRFPYSPVLNGSQGCDSTTTTQLIWTDSTPLALQVLLSTPEISPQEYWARQLQLLKSYLWLNTGEDVESSSTSAPHFLSWLSAPL